MLTLEIITPKQVMLNTQVKQVTLPGDAGEMGVLPGHLQLLTSLNSGVLKYTVDNEIHVMAVHYGFAEVNNDQVTVLANEAEAVDGIDLETAQADVESLTTQLNQAEKLSAEAAQLTQELTQAETRFAAASAHQAKHH